MKAIYMTYCNGEEYIPSRTKAQAQGVARMLKSENPAAECKVKKIMVSSWEYDIIMSEFGLEE